MRSLLAIQPSHGAMLGAATAATLVACLTAPTAARPAAIVIPATPVAAPAPVVPASVPAPVVPAPANPRARELVLAFRAGGETYVRLADLATGEASGLEMPRHGRVRHVDEDGVHAAIAVVAPRDVPASYAAWKDRTLEVEQGCHAKVNGFAVVARLTGDPGYASTTDDAPWSAATVMEGGSPVLAARLDGCVGQYARDAALAPVVVPEVVHDDALAAAGRAALIASAAAAETQREWDEQLRETGGARQVWTEQPGVVQAEVLRHPLTGETFVAVHGSVAGMCGDPEANLWGLFRVTGRTLTPVVLRQLGDLRVIDAILDVDGDGSFELLGKTWLENAELLTTASGEVLEHLDRPFYGCPC